MPPEDRAPYRLSLLGPWKLHGPDGREVRSVLAQPKRLCLLAYLARSGEPVSRTTLVALFWPDSDEGRARNALSQSLHYLRRSLGPDVVESVEGDRVRASPERLWFDARELMGGGTGEHVAEMAAHVRAGHDFFQGWNADDSQPLQSWLDEVRRQVRERAEEVVRVGERGRAQGVVRAGERRRAAGVVRAAGEGSEAKDDGDGSDGAGSDGGGSASGGGARRSRAMWVGGGGLVGVLLTVLVLVTRAGSADSGTGGERPIAPAAPASEPAELALLLPRVTVLDPEPSLPAAALAEALHDEMMVLLNTVEGARIISVKFESEVAELVRSLEAQGTIDPAQGRIDPPRWVVSVSVRTGGGQARVIGLLLAGPDYTAAGAVSEHDYDMPSSEAALIELPKRIAADVVGELGAVVGVGGG